MSVSCHGLGVSLYLPVFNAACFCSALIKTFRANSGLRHILICLLFCVHVPSNAASKLPQTIKKIKPSIVGVGTFQARRSPQALLRGTGFAVADGSLVVTNSHVLPVQLDEARMEKLTVFFNINNKSSMMAVQILASDAEHDIAILKLEKGSLPPLELGDTGSVQEGERYAFTGFPIGMILGLYPVTHHGIISAISPIAIPVLNTKDLNRTMMHRLRNPYKVFQLDATAYPGNSGSPLYDTESGAVIGVINKVFVKESKENVLSKPSGITYAIPIDHVKRLLNAQGPKQQLH